MAELTVLVVESESHIRKAIANQIEALKDVRLAGEAADPGAGQRLAAQHHADAVLLEMPASPEAALALAEWLRVEQPDALVIGAASSIQPDLMRRAMRAGLHDLLVRPIEPGQLKQVLDLARQRKGQRERAQEGKGRVIAVLGVGGGLGTTTVATNIAVALAGRTDAGMVLLADFDLEMGNVPCFLDLAPSRTYHDLRGQLDLPGPEGVRQLLPRHRTGVYMLAGPQEIEELDEVTADEVGAVVDICRTSFQFLIADAGHSLDDRATELLDRADLILLVTQLNVASLRSARRMSEVLRRLGYPPERVKVVANRMTRGGRIRLEDAEKSLGQPVSFTVPNDYPTVIASIDTGVTVVEAKRSSRTATSFRAIATALGPESPATNGGRPGLKRLFGARRVH